MKWGIVNPAEWERLYPRCRQFLLAAIERSGGLETEMGMLRWINQGIRQPVVILDDDEHVIGLLVLEQDDDALHVTSIAGELPKGWRPEAWDFLTQMAGRTGSTAIQLRGRKGWGRYIKEWGFKPNGDYLRAEL